MCTSGCVIAPRTQEDWAEWQANALGAALLMPTNAVSLMMWYLNQSNKITCYDGVYMDKDRRVINCFCDHFGVSKAAATIRLRQLGFVEDKSCSEYVHPLEVVYEPF